MILWHNGAWRDEDAPAFTALDRVRYGDGIFDTMLAVDGQPVFMNLHLDRILHNANILQLGNLPAAKDFKEISSELLKENDLLQGRAVINTLITRGQSERGLAPPKDARPSIVIRTTAAPPPPGPARLVIARTVRRNEGSPLSQIKSCNYGDNILALMEARNAGADDALLLNNAGYITCASTGNIFMISQKGELLTPPLSDGVMAGTTRRVILDLARQSGIKAHEESLDEATLMNAEDLFLTSSITGLRSIASFGKKDFLPSPMFKTLQKAYNSEIQKQL